MISQSLSLFFAFNKKSKKHKWGLFSVIVLTNLQNEGLLNLSIKY